MADLPLTNAALEFLGEKVRELQGKPTDDPGENRRVGKVTALVTAASITIGVIAKSCDQFDPVDHTVPPATSNPNN